MTSEAEPSTKLSDPLPIEPLSHAVAADIRVPGSKSLSNRHLILAALAETPTRLCGLLVCEDCDRLLVALSALGWMSRNDGDALLLEPPGVRTENDSAAELHARVNLGDGGTPTRFMMALAAAQRAGVCDIDGSARMRERPIAEGVELLRALGARIEYLEEDGRLPLRVFARGEMSGLRGGTLRVGRTASSQFVSALLLVAPTLTEGLDIEFTEEPTSASYLQLSLAALQAAGVEAEVAYRPVEATSSDTGLSRIRIRPQPIRGGTVSIEPDASSAVYPAAIAALSPKGVVTLAGLPRRSIQPDAFFFDDLALRGARVEETDRGLRVSARGTLRGIDSDYARAPDAAVMAMVLAAMCDRPSRITGLGTLRVKESDRIEAVAAGLRALGGTVETGDDWVRVHPLPPHSPQSSPVVIETVNDHRIAMAFAVLGFVRSRFDRPGFVRPCLEIANPSCVAKSWPGFWDMLDLLRGAVPGENGKR